MLSGAPTLITQNIPWLTPLKNENSGTRHFKRVAPGSALDLFTAHRADRDFLNLLLSGLHVSHRDALEFQSSAQPATFLGPRAGSRWPTAVGTLAALSRQECTALRADPLALSGRHHCRDHNVPPIFRKSLSKRQKTMKSGPPIEGDWQQPIAFLSHRIPPPISPEFFTSIAVHESNVKPA